MRTNLTIAAMAESDLAALTPHLSKVSLERGAVLTHQGTRVNYVYFPTTAHLANLVTYADGRVAEVFVMGLEGVSGLAPFLADLPCTWSIEVKKSGEAYRISAVALQCRLDASPSLRLQFNRLTSDYQSQAALGVACAALHTVRQRLARRLVALADRQQTVDLLVTQQDLADSLGVQRTTITATALDLNREHLVTQGRGRLTVLDLDGLRAEACECSSLEEKLATVPICYNPKK